MNVLPIKDIHLYFKYRLYLQVCEICWPDAPKAQIKYNIKGKHKSHANRSRIVHQQQSTALSKKRLSWATDPFSFCKSSAVTTVIWCNCHGVFYVVGICPTGTICLYCTFILLSNSSKEPLVSTAKSEIYEFLQQPMKKKSYYFFICNENACWGHLVFLKIRK